MRRTRQLSLRPTYVVRLFSSRHEQIAFPWPRSRAVGQLGPELRTVIGAKRSGAVSGTDSALRRGGSLSNGEPPSTFPGSLRAHLHAGALSSSGQMLEKPKNGATLSHIVSRLERLQGVELAPHLIPWSYYPRRTARFWQVKKRCGRHTAESTDNFRPCSLSSEALCWPRRPAKST